MTKHIHVHLHDSKDGGTSTERKSGGVTTWGGADPKKIVPKSPIDQFYKSKDGGPGSGPPKGGGQQHPEMRPSNQQIAQHVKAGGTPENVHHYEYNKKGERVPIYKDAGTSEGAKKAAETRKAHGGGASPQRPIFNAAHHYEQSEKHSNTAKSLAKGGTKEHNRAAELHNHASRLHKQATETGQPEHVAAAKTAANRANAASRKLGHVSHSFTGRDGGPGSGPQKGSQVIKPVSSTTEEQAHQQRIKTAHALGVEPEHMYPKHKRRFSDPRLS